MGKTEEECAKAKAEAIIDGIKKKCKDDPDCLKALTDGMKHKNTDGPTTDPNDI